MKPQERDSLIQRYAEGSARLRAALSKVPPRALGWQPEPGKWSVRQVVCHCADAEMNAASRIRYVIAEKEPLIAGYDQDRWIEIFYDEGHPLEGFLALIEAARAHTVPLLRRLTPEMWARKGKHTELDGPYTAESWLQIYAEHLEIHVRQIERTLDAWKKASVAGA